MSLKDKVRKLDIFKKTPHELSEGTNRGGILSILTVASIIGFLVVEINKYINPELIGGMLLDNPVTRKQMGVHLKMIFPRFPCEILSLDLQDAMLTHRPNIANARKYRLDSSGRDLDSEPFELLKQSNEEKQFAMAKNAFQKGYGCRVHGYFLVKEVPGNFHISSHAYQKIYARLRAEEIIQTVDMSHTIEHLFFGDMTSIQPMAKSHPEAVLKPLNNHTKKYDMRGTPHSYISHYHLDIVPTLYKAQLWTDTRAYQYTYNYNTFEVHTMPSVYFNYHVGGLLVAVHPQVDTMSQFLIKLCAIVGGTYAIATFIDNALDTLIADRAKQYQLIN